MTEHTRKCAVDGCERKPHSLGYCGKHYQRFKKWGDPLFVRVAKPPRPATDPSVHYLRPGEPIPKGEPKRYINVHGYAILRWRVAPRTYVETLEHRVINGRVTTAEHVHHIDRNKLNNHPSNLLHMDASDHLHAHYRIPRADVARLYAAGYTTIEIAELYDTFPGNISRIVRGEGVPTRRGLDARSRSLPFTPSQFAALVEEKRQQRRALEEADDAAHPNHQA